jgi:glycine/D-amino acid oxidase-like deaminating enzyme
MQIKSILIAGSGVFGASTALYMIRALPTWRIRLVDKDDFPSKSAASQDVNKIICTVFEDALYLKLALKARRI